MTRGPTHERVPEKNGPESVLEGGADGMGPGFLRGVNLFAVQAKRSSWRTVETLRIRQLSAADLLCQLCD
jgi:hypothetical protein